MLSGGESSEAHAVREASRVSSAGQSHARHCALLLRRHARRRAAGRNRDRRLARGLSARKLPGRRHRRRRARHDGRVVPHRRTVCDVELPGAVVLSGAINGERGRWRFAPTAKRSILCDAQIMRVMRESETYRRPHCALSATCSAVGIRRWRWHWGPSRGSSPANRRASGGAGRRHASPAADCDSGRDSEHFPRGTARHRGCAIRPFSNRFPSAAR